MTFKPARLLTVLFAAAAFPVFAQNIAVVNGKAIPTSRVDAMVKQMASQGQQDTPELRTMVKEELINREVLIQEADKLGLSSSADVKSQIDNARQSIVIRALVQDYLKKHPVPDADIQAEYDKFKAQAGDKEYHSRHILVEKEDDAKAIITKLKAGEKFEDLAKQSKDPGSANNGGDLDWASPASFVKPFSDAMVALQKGQVTEAPVKTQFGYHVIKLEDVRPAKVPVFEEVKPKIAESLQQKKLQEYQQNLRKAAKIK
jgi:peptidyl-prolyl cis-trans isomerase C